MDAVFAIAAAGMPHAAALAVMTLCQSRAIATIPARVPGNQSLLFAMLYHSFFSLCGIFLLHTGLLSKENVVLSKDTDLLSKDNEALFKDNAALSKDTGLLSKNYVMKAKNHAQKSKNSETAF
jgi:hypothetical protein